MNVPVEDTPLSQLFVPLNANALKEHFMQSIFMQFQNMLA